MTTALCTACGAMKFGAWLPCKTCGASSTGNRDLDVFMSDHYLDEAALSFLGGVVGRISEVVGQPDAVQRIFLYWASKRLPGLMNIDVDPETRAEIESALAQAHLPLVPSELVFRFDTPIAKRKTKPWWRVW